MTPEELAERRKLNSRVNNTHMKRKKAHKINRAYSVSPEVRKVWIGIIEMINPPERIPEELGPTKNDLDNDRIFWQEYWYFKYPDRYGPWKDCFTEVNPEDVTTVTPLQYDELSSVKTNQNSSYSLHRPSGYDDKLDLETKAMISKAVEKALYKRSK